MTAGLPDIEQRPLGRTGQMVSILGVGGSHLAKASQKEAVRIVREAIDHGVTFMDNAREYGEGKSERWMGLALKVIRTDEALRYCFSLPVSTVVSGMDSVRVLRKNLRLTATFKSYHAGDMDALRQRARVVAGDGRFERYKTTQEFDGPHGREAHGFGVPAKRSSR